MSHRWGKPADIQAAARKLQQIPKTCGPWEATTSDKLDEQVQRILESAGYILRTYIHQETRASVQVAILLGPPGPTSVHTPDICYASHDYTTVQENERWELTDGQRRHAFWAMTLKPVELNASQLRVYHAWTTGDQWSAPDNARFEFAGSRYLYKIQLACPLADVSVAGTDKDPGREFLRYFVSAAQPYLVPPEEQLQ